jgi:hypothetical protein
MSEPICRESTKEEHERSKELALALADVILAADIATGMGALGMLTESMFLNGMKPEYVLKGFDEYCQFTRKQIEKGLRRAHN